MAEGATHYTCIVEYSEAVNGEPVHREVQGSVPKAVLEVLVPVPSHAHMPG